METDREVRDICLSVTRWHFVKTTEPIITQSTGSQVTGRVEKTGDFRPAEIIVCL